MFIAFYCAGASRNFRVYGFAVLLCWLFPALAIVADGQRTGTLDTGFSGDGIAYTSFAG